MAHEDRAHRRRQSHPGWHAAPPSQPGAGQRRRRHPAATARSSARAERLRQVHSRRAADGDAQHPLHAAPQQIGADQHRRIRRRQQPARLAQPGQRAPAWSDCTAPPGRSAACDQLQCLGDELHLDLPAGAQLHVPRPGGRQVAQPAGRASPRRRRGCARAGRRRPAHRAIAAATFARAAPPGRPPPAPGSAPCAPRSTPPPHGSGGRRPARPRPGPCCRTGAAACPPRTSARPLPARSAPRHRRARRG